MPPKASTPARPEALPPGKRVAAVEPGSIAERIGIRAGDMLLRLNGRAVEDDLDCWFQGASERITIEWQHPDDAELLTRQIRKQFDSPLGLRLDTFDVRQCNNRCIFCFVHQLPRGMRRELYVKDEDYRLSFLHGNYITATNLQPEDRERISRLKLSPLYISVHATNQTIRDHILGRENTEPIMDVLRWFAVASICIRRSCCARALTTAMSSIKPSRTWPPCIPRWRQSRLCQWA